MQFRHKPEWPARSRKWVGALFWALMVGATLFARARDNGQLDTGALRARLARFTTALRARLGRGPGKSEPKEQHGRDV